MNEKLIYRRIRNYCGLLGGLLPFIAIFSVLLIGDRPEHALYSISATYYLSPALAGILTSAAIVLMCYDGYDLLDNVITTLSGVFGIGIVLFPCSVDFMCGTVGFFQLDMSLSNKIHCVCASIFFCLLSFNSYFLFTKNNGNMTEQKKKRNKVYKICGIGMFIFMAWQIITSSISFFSGWWTMINEIFLLFFFSVSWLTKGNALFFKEKE